MALSFLFFPPQKTSMSSSLLQSSNDDIPSDNVVRKTDSWREIYKSQEFAQFAPAPRRTENRLHTSTSATAVATSDISSTNADISNRTSEIMRHSQNWRTNQTSSFDMPNVVTNHQSRSESTTRNRSHTHTDISTQEDILNMTFPAQSLESEWNTTLAEQAMILAKFEQDGKRSKTSTINT